MVRLFRAEWGFGWGFPGRCPRNGANLQNHTFAVLLSQVLKWTPVLGLDGPRAIGGVSRRGASGQGHLKICRCRERGELP